jgi:hypothetical protein
VIFTYVLTIYFNYIYPLHHSLSFFPLLRTISTGFIVLFSYVNTKSIHHIHSLYPFLMPLSFPLLLSLPPGKEFCLFWKPVLPSVLHCCELYIDSSKGFCLGISDMYLLCFNQINTPITYSFLFLCSPIIQQLTGHCIILSSYIDVIFFTP